MKKRWILFFLVIGAAVIGCICFLFLKPRDPDMTQYMLKPTATAQANAAATKEPAAPTAAPEPEATDPPAAEAEDSGEETLTTADLYRTGQPGVDFALGAGPGTAGYQEADGYGVETAVVYSPEEIAAAPAFTAQVSPGEPVASLAGITVDFTAVNLASETATLTVRALPARTDEANGYAVTAWDLELTGQDTFEDPVAVTLPYGDLAGRDPAAVVIPQHYNRELGRWEYVSCDLHPEDGTVTAYLTHFSPVSVILRMLGLEEEEPEQLNSEQSRMLKLTVMPEQIKSELEENTTVRSQLENFGTIIARAKADQQTLYENGGILETAYKNIGNCFDSASLTASLLEYMKYIGPKTAGAFSSISLAYLTYDTGKKATEQYLNNKSGDSVLTLLKASPDFIVGLLSVKAASDAIAGASTLAIAQPEILLTVGAVLLVKNIMDANYPAGEETKPSMSPMDRAYFTAPYTNLYWDRRSHEIIAIPPAIGEDFNDTEIRRMQRDGIEPTDNPDPDVMIQVSFGDSLYNTYYTREFLEVYDEFRARRAAFREAGTNELGSWATTQYDIVRLGPLYEDANDWWNPGWRDILNYIRETHREDPENWFPVLLGYLEKADEAAFEYAYNRGVFTGYQVADNQLSSADIIGTLLDRMKRRSMFKSFNESCLAASDQKNIANWQTLKKHQNRVVRFRLQDKEGKPMTFADSEYAGRFIILDTNPKEYTLSEPWVADMNQSDYLTCTYNGYVMAGSPENLLVYASREAWEKQEKPVKTIPLGKVGEKNITKTLKLPRARRAGTVYRFKESANACFGDYGSWITHLMEKAVENLTVTLGEDGSFAVHGDAEDRQEAEREWVSIGLMNSSSGYWFSRGYEYTLSFDLSGKLDRTQNAGTCAITGKVGGWEEVTKGDYVSRETYDFDFQGEGSEVRLEQTEDGEALIIGFLHHEENDVCEMTIRKKTTYSNVDRVKTETSDWIFRLKLIRE